MSTDISPTLGEGDRGDRADPYRRIHRTDFILQPDALICSHPRSGGRWLRFLLAHYLTARHELSDQVTLEHVFSVVPDHNEDPGRGYPAFEYRAHRALPLVAVCHRPYEWRLHRGLPTIFLARNAYDVVVSAYYYGREKDGYQGTIRDFLDRPRNSLIEWIDYMNRWAPALLTHRDATLLAYGRLHAAPDRALIQLLEFLDERPISHLVHAAVDRAHELRDSRRIRTGQEGNFWDHLPPEEIFEIQEIVHRELSEPAQHLLSSIGVELDPFPRSD